MGDDPFVPVGHAASHGSSNAVNYFINHLGKPSLTIIVVAVGMALGISVGALVNGNSTATHYKDELDGVKDQLRITERELRMNQYYLNILNQTLAEQHIQFPRYEEFKQSHQEKE
jgi:hypothetical protein